MRVVVWREPLPLRADVHLARPVSLSALEKIVSRMKPREISMAPSTYERLSRRAKEFLKSKGIKVVLEKNPGRSARMDKESLEAILELRKAGYSIRRISEETGIPKSTVHYILTYFQGKLRAGPVNLVP